jgi:hypothetical protein
MEGYALNISPGTTTVLKPYLSLQSAHSPCEHRSEDSRRTHASATPRQASSSPPSTNTVLSLYSSRSAKGVWLWMNMPKSSGTCSFRVNSAIRSDSGFPPPFVSRMKGIFSDWRSWRAEAARGIASWARRRTPSIL